CSFILLASRGQTVDSCLENMAWAKDENAARQDRHFFPGLWIATDAAPLLSYRKRPEPTDFNRFTGFKSGRHPIQHRFQEIRRFISGEADLGINHLGEMGTGYGDHASTLCRSCRHVKIRVQNKSQDQAVARSAMT